MVGEPRITRVQACPVCGEPVDPRADAVRAWPGKYAHADCASYERRPRWRRRGDSHRLHRKFTRT